MSSLRASPLAVRSAHGAALSGHKTENVYRRYHIIVERDLSDATKRMDQYFGAMKAQAAKQSETTNPDATGTFPTHQPPQPNSLS